VGIRTNIAKVFSSKKEEYKYSGKLLTLGRMEVEIKDPELKKEFGIDDSNVNPEHFFQSLGFSICDSLDYSSKDGANIIHDLNTIVPKSLENQYDFIIDCGTMEHCFDVFTVMKNISLMLKTGGTIIHLSPFNGYTNHCFYIFSPTFFFSYYRANRFEDIDVFFIEHFENDRVRIIPVDNYNNMDFRSVKCDILCRAVKAEEGKIRAPIQEFYYKIFKEKEKVKGKMIKDEIYQKIVGNIPENNYEEILKKSYFL
jgi:hypothetical protein